MQISSGLLVALMFVSILSLGIVSILGSFAAAVVKGSRSSLDGFHTSWRLLFLLTHFNLFWQTTTILGVESWDFLGFLYIVLGPVLMFFASSTLIEIDPASNDEAMRQATPQLFQRFFILLALTQVWVLGTDLMFAGGFQLLSAFNALTLVIALLLAFKTAPTPRKVGTVFAWLLYLVSIGLQVAGVVN